MFEKKIGDENVRENESRTRQQVSKPLYFVQLELAHIIYKRKGVNESQKRCFHWTGLLPTSLVDLLVAGELAKCKQKSGQ